MMADLENLKVQDAEFDRVIRGRVPGPNPMEKYYLQSLNADGATKSFWVDGSDVKTVERQFRAAAMSYQKGVSIQFQVDGEVVPFAAFQDGEIPDEARVKVLWYARERQKQNRAPRGKKDGASKKDTK